MIGLESEARGRSAETSPPLARLRVVDLTDLRGALAGRILAELGADVIRVDPPLDDPEPTRFAGAADAPSIAFLYRNAGKRGARFDFDQPADRQRFATLCDAADVLIENLGPGRAQRYGLTPEDVRRIHPRLVHAAVSDFGRHGPRAGWRLEPLPAFAASGALFASGFPDRPPCWLPGYLAHDCASIFAVAGIVAAILDRARHGDGQTIEVSVQEAALNGLHPWSIPLADYVHLTPLLPASVPRDADGPYLVLPTRDGHVRVLPGTPRQLSAFASLLWSPSAGEHGEPRPTSDSRPARAPSRGSVLSSIATHVAGRAFDLVAFLLAPAARVIPFSFLSLTTARSTLSLFRSVAARALASRPQAEVLGAARLLGVPMAAVNTPAEFVAEPQTQARRTFVATGFPGVGDAPFARLPCNFSRTPAVLRRPAPAAGRDAASLGANASGTAKRDDDDPAAAWREAAPAGRRDWMRARDPGREATPLLQGVRVVSLGVGAVVPEMCWLLAELGAEVVKIESRANLDFLRRVAVGLGRPNRSWMFNDANRGQKSVCLDLRTTRGRDLALQLCAIADVVAENNRGGVVEALGLDYEDVRRVRPDVIYLASQGYGRGGPLGEAPAFGPLAAAFAGANWLWNHPDAPYPAGSSLNHPDHIASKLGLIAVLAALDHRRRTGEGQMIEMAQSEVAAFLIGEHYLQAVLGPHPLAPSGNASGDACPHGVYPCRGTDRWCAIAVVGDAAWRRFCGCLGWREEALLATLAGRLAGRTQLDDRVAQWTRTRSPEDAAAELQAAGISAMAVQGPLDHRGDPHLAERGALITVVHPEVGPVRHTANPLRMSRTRIRRAGPAPLLGADTEDVLTRLLGLEAREVEALVADRICW